MKKITLMLLFFITALTYGQSYQFDIVEGPTLIANNAGTSIVFNDAGNSENIPDNIYDSFTITADWTQVSGGPFSSEARVSIEIAGGATTFLAPSSGGATSTAPALLTFTGDLPALYDPSLDGSFEVFFNQTWGGSSANWANITVTINEAPACISPVGLEAEVTGTSSADLSWDAVSNAESYNWFVFEQGANIETDTPADSGTSATNSATSTGLNPSTFYFFYVVTDCGVDDGVSENSATVPFATECDTFGDFSNDFSDEVTFELPLCWTGNTVSTGTAPNLRVTTVGSPQFGTKQIHMQSSGDANTVHHLISPELNNLGTVDKRLRISARQLSATQTNALEVGVMSDPSDLSTFSVIETINFEGNTLTDYDIILPEGTTENYFAFKTIFSGTFQTIYIDRVVYEDNPSCLEPSGVSEVSVGLNSVEIEWNEVVGVDDYEVAYGEAGFDPETEGDILLIEGFTTATILGLLEGEEYDFYVRALCSDVDISSWSDVLSALTLVEGATCDVAIPITSLPFTDSGNTADFGDNYSNTDRPSIDNAQFTDGTGGASYLNGDDVVYSFTPANDGVFNFELNDIGTWVGFWLFEGCSPFTGTIAYSTTSSGNDRLLPAIQLEAGVTYYVVISTWPTPQSTPYELVVTEVLCASPSELEVDTIAADSAEFSWTASADADAYDWFLMNEGENPEDDTPVDSGSTVDTTLVVEDLDADTNYTLFVRSDCSASESDFIQVSFFTGYCVPVSTSNFAQDYISLFETSNALGDVSIAASAVVPGAYRNLSASDTIQVFAGQEVDFELVYADTFGSTQMQIWVDWNNDLTFAGDESLFQLHSSDNVKNGLFTIPSDVPNGTYRFRVRAEWTSTDTGGPTPCDNVTYGDTIDLSIEVTDQPDPTFANVQIIHNSPDPAASSVDVYVNGDLLPELTGLDFRNATAFLEVPAETDLEIDVVPAGGELSASVHNQTFNLAPDENYVVVANGLLADFELTVFSGARLAADDASDVDVLVHHGSPDAPAVDVAIDGVGVVVPNISFPQFQGYLSVSPVDVELQILPAGGDTPVAVYAAPLSALEGAAVTVVASGLFGDGAVESNSFGLWVATATGGALIELPLVDEDDDAPMEPAPTPTEDENLVISLFSNAYDDVPVNTWLTPWSNAQLEDIQIQGVDTKLYTNLDFAGVEMTGDNSIDATQMTKFHVDVWTPNMTTVRVKLVDFGPDNAFGGGDDTEHELVFEDLTIGEWNSLELDLEDFVNLTNTANISQLIFSGLVDGVPGLGTLYVDNVYFSQPSLSNVDFDAANFTYYPNPVKNELTIQSANTVEKVEVYNMLGQRVINARPNSKTPSVQMGDLTSGVYLMKVSINGTEKSFQVIKQ